MIAGSIGQKSWAKRCVKGRPTMAETSRATRDDDGTGRRLRKVDECAPREEGDHGPQSDQDRTEQQQHRDPFTLSRRRPSARYDHVSAAISAPLKPVRTRSR